MTQESLGEQRRKAPLNVNKNVQQQAWTEAFAKKSADAFQKALAQDIVLEANTPVQPVEGIDHVTVVMATASAIYERLIFTQEMSNGLRTYLEWEARAFGGIELFGITVLSKNAKGEIARVAIHHRPLNGALCRFALWCSAGIMKRFGRLGMRRLLLGAVCASALLFGFAPTSKTQTKPEKSSSGQNQSKPKIIALNTNDLEAFDYDAGKVKLIATGEDTNGAYAVVELTEMPSYKTAWHQHNNCEEAFYVVEGVLTIQLADKLYEMPAGSYILIPRGTPHGQGNFTNKPVRLLTTFTPGGFDLFFRDRVELYKTVKPGDPAFQKRFDGLRAKHKQWVEILGMWNPRK